MSITDGPTEPLRIGSSMDFPPTLRVAEAAAGGSTVLSLLARVAEVGVIERLPWTECALALQYGYCSALLKASQNQARSRIRRSLLRILVAERLAVLIIREQ